MCPEMKFEKVATGHWRLISTSGFDHKAISRDSYCTHTPNFIKIDNLQLSYCDLTIFSMGAVRPPLFDRKWILIFHCLWDAILAFSTLCTRFDADISTMTDWGMPTKQNPKWRPPTAHFYFHFQIRHIASSVDQPTKFSKIGQCMVELNFDKFSR